MNKLMEKMAYWLLPPGIEHLLRQTTLRNQELVSPALRGILAQNNVWRNCHINDHRCFILASGPSINHQDLTLLKNEICISVSNSYVHKDYPLIQPIYHCVPFIGAHKQITSEDAVAWLRHMEESTGSTIMFFSYRDKEMIEQNGLFRNKQVHYIHTGFDSIGVEQGKGLDLTRQMLGYQSVSVLALAIAVFMGFPKIYLLGCDHDWILNWGTSSHFYSKNEHTILSRQGYREWLETDDYEVGFRNYLCLWEQYKAIRKYALTKEIEIYNATSGGILDVFPRVDYKSLFEG